MTRYQIRVRLPESVLEDRRISLLIAQRSLNPNCPPPENRSSYLDLALARTIPEGGPPIGPTAAEPTAGVETIATWIQDQTDQFSFSATVIDPRLDGAIITTVTNTSTDRDRRPVRLVNVQLRDEIGAQRNADLEPASSTGDFAGLRIKGGWSLRVTDLSAVFLDPRRVSLDVAWRRP